MLWIDILLTVFAVLIVLTAVSMFVIMGIVVVRELLEEHKKNGHKHQLY